MSPRAQREKSREKNSEKSLLQIVERQIIELFSSKTNGSAWATVRVADHQENVRIDAEEFRQWASLVYYRATGAAATSATMQQAVDLFQARARADGPKRRLSERVAGLGSELYIDLGDSQWRVIKVTPDGWEVLDEPPAEVKFRRGSGVLALPWPERGGSLDELRELLRLPPDVFTLLAGGLVSAFNPRGSKPILIVQGEQGSGKTTLQRIVRSLVDPSAAPTCTLPRRQEDLFVQAHNSFMLAYDNVSQLSPWLSDEFCRLSTGGGMSKRRNYSDDAESLISVQRAVMLDGITDFASRPDLLDRAILIRLPPMDRRLTERELTERFEKARPRILGALLDAVSAALGSGRSGKRSDASRMADAVAWVTSAEGAMGWPPGTFERAYRASRAEARQVAIEESPLAAWLINFAAARKRWSGTATELLEIVKRAELGAGAPRAANALSAELRRLAPDLRALGVEITFGRAGDRKNARTIEIVLTYRTPGPSRAIASSSDDDRTASDDPSTASEPAPEAASDDSDGSDDPLYLLIEEEKRSIGEKKGEIREEKISPKDRANRPTVAAAPEAGFSDLASDGRTIPTVGEPAEQNGDKDYREAAPSEPTEAELRAEGLLIEVIDPFPERESEEPAPRAANERRSRLPYAKPELKSIGEPPSPVEVQAFRVKLARAAGGEWPDDEKLICFLAEKIRLERPELVGNEHRILATIAVERTAGVLRWA